MKVLVLNDLHITATPPEGCKPVYLEDIFTMLEEARQIAISQHVDHTIFTGDLFHRPTAPFRVVNRFIRLLQDWPARKMAIVGNHDLDDSGIAGLDNTALGT